MEGYHEVTGRGKALIQLDALLFMMLQEAIDRAPCGHGRDPLLCQPLLDGRGTPPFAAWSQCPVQIDDRLCNRRWGLARMTPGSSGLFRRPAWISCLVALFPLVKPTFRARQLAADLLDFVPGKLSRHRVLSALVLGVGHSDLLGSLLVCVAGCRLFSMSWHNPSLSAPLYGCWWRGARHWTTSMDFGS
jgi:hypothetical protein